MAVVLSALMALSVLAPVAAAGSGPAAPADAVDSPAATPVQDTQQRTVDNHSDAPPDPEEDVLGWENGYWYNESIDIDRSDGLNDSELDKVVARSMARVEEVRELEFEETVPVEIISREEYQSGGSDYTPSTEDRLHQNTKWEATFMVNESTDAIATQQSNRGATVGGFYSPTEDRIVIISENATSPKLDEITLSQELFHALQDQKWNTLNYFGDTTERNNAYNGIIEGDGNYVDYLYEQRCNEEWDCLLPPENGGGGGSADINFGIYFVSFQPYSNGPAFVQQIREEGGWEAVNDVYDNPPVSSEQVIHPEKYPDETPSEVTVDTNPQNGWEVLDMGENSVDYAVFGEAGIASMVYYPSYESAVAGGPRDVTVPVSEFFNTDSQGNIADINPYTYDFEASEGWDGDKMYPIVTDESAETNETAYVWQTQWDTEEDAEEFASMYHTILESKGGERVDGLQNTWRIPDSNEFGDAFWVQRDGTTVMIVNAPTQDDLQDVHPSVEFEETEQDGDGQDGDSDDGEMTSTAAPTTAMDDGTATEAMDDGTATEAMDDGTATDGEDGDGGSPGLTAVAALAALALAALGLRRRER
jgi:MYXO-CTERM domain-containing protein